MNAEQESTEPQENDGATINEALEQNDTKVNSDDCEENNGQPSLTIEELSTQLEQANAKVQENWDKALRIQAEMENLKKRSQKDVENAHKFALEGFAKEMLVVVDSLEMGIQAAIADVPEVISLREGSELTLKQFQAGLRKFNIIAIDPTGETFNPAQHQAMSMTETDEAEPNTVVTVFQKGYLLNSRVIRPAMVVVAKAPESKQEA